MAAERTNVSNDLIWQLTRNQNAYLVRRNAGGGSQLSRDPLNLVNKHSFKYAGYTNNKAIGVHGNEEGGVTVITKKPGSSQQPAKAEVKVNYGPKTATRKIYKGVADLTAKNGYRADLREEAVARVSAIRRSQKPKKETPAPKLRGAKARKAEQEE
ncbi:ribosomal L28e protein family-domain-containing protein [Penicillium chermesinum]|uniref:Ribosomal L28e protein family-domain-containing protein n=1 Tax=Penicillium chermesinum TaxID=63820 RepID=A0A9W9PKF6_9EURO|nr:ribosomal L28e protein family-domain-containing protein [Penicillium chermesinum]KAJ5246942.1 ribosomal L28e protein family-domain-containing protein [Penicillium chermesinum]KAJ6145196.1 ribosomal L28e protein family-domain-containing protein [Penicillium chermesinum]